MNPEQPTSDQPYREQIVLTIDDQSKVGLVMELLSHFDLVRARREQVQGTPNKVNGAVAESPIAIEPVTGSDEDLWALAGIWKDRDITAEQLRQQAWQRRTQQYDQ
ncbi:MAG: hypothetical protein M3Y54_01840 [Bacteroidota bacterium]|nr:hypothetical protein [Bacteroidota bacterium]